MNYTGSGWSRAAAAWGRLTQAMVDSRVIRLLDHADLYLRFYLHKKDMQYMRIEAYTHIKRIRAEHIYVSIAPAGFLHRQMFVFDQCSLPQAPYNRRRC